MNASELYKFLSDPDLVDLIEHVKISDDIFDVIGLTENQHSDILAWCISPNEGHAQGDAVIKDFLLAAYAARDGATFDNKIFFAEWTPGRIQTSSFGAAFVTREFSVKVKDGDQNGRLDLFIVDTQNKIVVAIENKAGALITASRLSRHHTAVNNQIAKRSAFSDYKFLFVVLDRNLEKYDEDYLNELGTKWALLDYSWLQHSANRARLQVARNNQAAQLLVAYCENQTDWKNPAECILSELLVKLSINHEPVINALRDLKKKKLSEWTPDKLLGHEDELMLFINQHRQLCGHLVQAQGIAEITFRASSQP